MDPREGHQLRAGLIAQPLSSIASIGGGAWVTVEGRVRAARKGPSVQTPLGELPCLAYLLEYWDESVIGDRSSEHFERIRGPTHQEAGGCDFLVEDDSGRALVRIEHAFVALTPANGSWSRQRAVRHAGFLSARGLPSPFLPGRPNEVDRELCFREATLIVSERVTVWGYARTEPDPELLAPGGGPFRSAATRAVITGSAEWPAYVIQHESM